jgi:hypothetical protein
MGFELGVVPIVSPPVLTTGSLLLIEFGRSVHLLSDIPDATLTQPRFSFDIPLDNLSSSNVQVSPRRMAQPPPILESPWY